MTASRSIDRRKGFVHRSAPRIWQDGFPLGNGAIGAMLWGDGDPLSLTLDSSELWDDRRDETGPEEPRRTYALLCRLIEEKRFDEADRLFGTREGKRTPYPAKLSAGRFELALGAAEAYEVTLDLDRATAEGSIQTAGRRHDVLCFVHRKRPLLCLRVADLPAEAALRFRPLGEVCPAMSALGYDPPGVAEADGVHVHAQAVPAGASYAVAWTVAGDDIFIALATADGAANAAADAGREVREARAIGLDALHREHVRLWKRFWRRPVVALPEARAEFYWRYGIYLLASSARRGRMPPGLQGLWAMDGVMPPWSGSYTLDMNVQETFWPACVTGHLDLFDIWCDYMQARLPDIQAHTRRVFESEGAFWPCTLIGHAPPDFGGGPWYALNYSWSHGGWLGWMLWLRWRYSMDRTWLRKTGYPLLAEIFKFFRANLREEEDGYLHVPLSSSPEYHGHCAREAFCKDPNIDLALIRKTCDWLVAMEAALGIDDLTPAARGIRERLAPYALTEKNELCLWPGKEADESHRHPSHLMAIHPAMDLTIDDADARDIILASIRRFLALGQFHWAGHTYAQVIGMAAVIGQAEWAYDSLRQFMDRWTMPNGLHVNADWRGCGASWFGALCQDGRTRDKAPFTMEANNAVSAGIGDMLVQGWGDTVRIFPAVPEHWRDVYFEELLTEGAFRVSALRRHGQTLWVRIAAGTDRELRLRDPFPEAEVEQAGADVQRRDGIWTADLRRGETLALCRAGFAFDRRAEMRAVRASGCDLLGLPPEGEGGSERKK